MELSAIDPAEGEMTKQTGKYKGLGERAPPFIFVCFFPSISTTIASWRVLVVHAWCACVKLYVKALLYINCCCFVCICKT